MSLLQMSISAGIMMIAVAIIRLLALNRLPKKMFLFFWEIILIRLLIPFSFSSPFSVYSLTNRFYAGQAAEIPSANMLSAAPTEHIPAVPNGGSVPWLWIWGTGTAICVGYYLIAYFKCRLEFRISRPAESAFAAHWLSEHKCLRRITIRQAGIISSPLTYGMFRPVILMPEETDWADQKGLQYVLAHEYVHIRRFDGIVKFFLTAALCIHWFNPLVWGMYILANRDLELSCDEAVVHMFGDSLKSAYALALIEMEEKKSGLVPLCNNFSKNAIEERVEAIMKMKKTSAVAIAAALSMIGGVTTVFATSVPAEPDHSISTEIGTLMVQTDHSDGPYRYSDDNGATWISEEDYKTKYPQDDIVWWTYDEYKRWLEEYSARLQSYVGSGAKYKDRNGSWTEWTQEHVDEVIKREEGILDTIKNGGKVSKTINGDDSNVMIVNIPDRGEIGVSYGAVVSDQDGEIIDLDFGEFASEEELLAAVTQYCRDQVENGTMSQEEADRFIKEYQ